MRARALVLGVVITGIFGCSRVRTPEEVAFEQRCLRCHDAEIAYARNFHISDSASVRRSIDAMIERMRLYDTLWMSRSEGDQIGNYLLEYHMNNPSSH